MADTDDARRQRIELNLRNQVARAIGRAERAEAEAAALREAAREIVETNFPTQRQYVQMQNRLAAVLKAREAGGE